MKKISAIISLLLAFAFILPAIPTQALSFNPPQATHSEAVYLMNLDTDMVIFEKNADKKEFPASLTKIMTAILVLENIADLDNTMIEAPPYIFDELYLAGASTADFRPYETASAKDLMYGMLLQSACEAASILGDHVGGGSIGTFVEMMNAKAVELGATNTHFTNAHGLFDANQYTTARDMAVITRFAMGLPRFNDIVGTTIYEVAASNKHDKPRTVKNTVTMMFKESEYYYPYIKGIKTGTLDEAGRCLITSASKDGYNYLLVTLKAPLTNAEKEAKFYNFEDAKMLYDWAFKNFAITNLLTTGEEIGEIPVKFSASDDFVIIHPTEDFSMLWDTSVDLSNIQRVITHDEETIAPVKKGAKLGTMELKLSGETLVSVDLVSSSDIQRSALKYNLDVAKRFTSSPWFKGGVAIVLALIVGYVVLYVTLTRKKRRRMKRVNKDRKF